MALTFIQGYTYVDHENIKMFDYFRNCSSYVGKVVVVVVVNLVYRRVHRSGTDSRSGRSSD